VTDSGCVDGELDRWLETESRGRNGWIHGEMMRVPDGQRRLEPDTQIYLVLSWASVELVLRHPPSANQK
jgi:hypothetical protein